MSNAETRTKDKLMLIDGHSIINRAYYGVPTLTNSEGLHTNAVYGFLNIMIKLIEEERPQYLVVAFDLPAPTFRHKKYAEYKGTRKAMPDELRAQVPLLKDVIKAMKIAIAELEGYEADDILGTLSGRAAEHGLDCVIVSGDRDLLQLASDTLKIRIPKTKHGKTEVEDYYAADVIERIGVTPSEYIDVKALMGDSSDNIPGVPGIGEVTALKIIKEYHNIETAIENAANIKPKKASENIVTYSEQANLSKELATIDCNAPIDLDILKAGLRLTHGKDVYDIFKRLGFKSLLEKLNIETPEQTGVQGAAISVPIKILTVDSLKMLTDKILTRKSEIAYYICVEKNALIWVSLYVSGGTVYYIMNSEKLTEDRIVLGLKPLFESCEIPKVTWDAKIGIHILNRYSVQLNNLVLDTMIAAYLLDPLSSDYSFDKLAMRYLDKSLRSFDELMREGRTKKGKNNWNELSEALLSESCRTAVTSVSKIAPLLIKKLEVEGLSELYYNIEHPLLFVLAEMETAGIKIDSTQLRGFGDKLQLMIASIEQEIFELAGETFNVGSPKQLGVILFEKLKLKNGKKTKTGYSTGADVLEKLAGEHPIIDKITEYRMYTKLQSTYVEGMLNVINKDTGKINTTFNQTITATGRLSSTEPNLQNIPIRLELGRELRKVFIPENEEFVFVDADYSQIELRLLAHMSDDETFINAFRNGDDIHRITASQVFKVDYDAVTPEMRRNAKAVNFGIIYGISAFSLSQDLHISKKEADSYINKYFEKYPNVKRYLDNVVREAAINGFVQTLYGRKRQMPELASLNFIQKSFGERVAMNMPIQGTAADIIKIAMIKVRNRLKEANLRSRLLLQIHDELLIEAHVTELDEVTKMLKNEMETAVKLNVPLDVDIHVGETWFDAK